MTPSVRTPTHHGCSNEVTSAVNDKVHDIYRLPVFGNVGVDVDSVVGDVCKFHVTDGQDPCAQNVVGSCYSFSSGCKTGDELSGSSRDVNYTSYEDDEHEEVEVVVSPPPGFGFHEETP